jgi:hypothetical protein
MEKIVLFVFVVLVAFVMCISHYESFFTQHEHEEIQEANNETETPREKREADTDADRFLYYNNRAVNDQIKAIIEKATLEAERENGSSIFIKIPDIKLSKIIHHREMEIRSHLKEFERRVLLLDDANEFKETLLQDLANRKKRRLIEVIFPIAPSTIITTTTTTTTKTTLKIEVDIVPRILGMFGVVTSFDEDEKAKTCMMHEKAKEEKESGNG